MKKFLFAIIICFICNTLFSQSYAIRKWDYIGKRICNSAQFNDMNFNGVGYNNLIYTDSISYQNAQPKISYYVWNSYRDGCRIYNRGAIMSIIGGAMGFVSGIMMLHNYSSLKHFGTTDISPKITTSLSIVGGLTFGLGVTFMLVGRGDKRACNISTYKDYNYNK